MITATVVVVVVVVVVVEVAVVVVVVVGVLVVALGSLRWWLSLTRMLLRQVCMILLRSSETWA